MTILEAYELFIMDRRVNGATEKTLLFYRDTTKKFVQFCGDGCNLQDAPKQIQPYIISLQDRQLAQNSIHTHWRALKTLWRFVFAEGLVSDLPKLPRIVAEDKEVQPLSPAQASAVFDSFNTSVFAGLRNRVLMLTLFDTGIRLSELTGVCMGDVDMENRWILVHGKGGKDRGVPFSSPTKRELWQYMKQRSRYASTEALFITQRGTPLSSRAVQSMFKRVAKRLQLAGVRLSPHTMRHSFALNWIENGGDPFSLQKILGHTTQSMTSRYVAMARSTMGAQHAKFSPVEHMHRMMR